MKKLIAKIIHLVNPNFFDNKTYGYLATWGIDDVIDGKLIFASNSLKTE